MQFPKVDFDPVKCSSPNPLFQPILQNLQANILKAHGRKFAYHLFLHLDATKIDQVKKWIAKFATTRITSALKLEQGRQIFKATGIDGGAVLNLSISATGYRALGIRDNYLPKEQATLDNRSCRTNHPASMGKS